MNGDVIVVNARSAEQLARIDGFTIPLEIEQYMPDNLGAIVNRGQLVGVLNLETEQVIELDRRMFDFPFAPVSVQI